MKIRTEENSEIEIEESSLQEPDKFVYLGSELRKGSDIRNEVGIRIGKAGASSYRFAIGFKGGPVSEWYNTNPR